MNQLSDEKRAQVVQCLVEGNSIRSTVRMTGAGKNTIARLLEDLGEACAEFHHKTVRDLKTRVVQCDEIWSFVGKKEAHRPKAERGTLGEGDVWTWLALDSDSKLAITWHLGLRHTEDAEAFCADLAGRLSRRVQISTDGFGAYRDAILAAFMNDVDFGQVIKTYGVEPEAEKRYSPQKCLSMETVSIQGEPLESQICTSHVERLNLSLRMSNRRFTRLTNAFSKKIENHAHALALHFIAYNFAKPNGALKKKGEGHRTPAMAAGLTDHVWTAREIVGLLA